MRILDVCKHNRAHPPIECTSIKVTSARCKQHTHTAIAGKDAVFVVSPPAQKKIEH